MLEKNLTRVYNKFKLHLYGQFLREPDEKQEDSLSVQEIVYLELIIALRRPTINDFAHYAGLSGPNAAYRINRLINKGYISKIQSKKDKREYHLRLRISKAAIVLDDLGAISGDHKAEI